MSLSDAEILELNALCSAVVDRTLDRASNARLNALLGGSEEARRFYVRSMAQSASLHDYAGELQSDEPEERIVRVGAWRWTIGALAAAAVLVLALWIGHSTTRRSETIAAIRDEALVATLSATDGCRWNGESPALGDELRQGQQLQLVSGLAEITFNSGAQVVLEGPAALDLASAWGAVLQRGSLRANVPPEAIGFRVSNADVEVTDLGTEFSMVAGENGGTEVFVLKGSVEASAEGKAQPITLRESQARRFDRSRISEVRDREQKLKRWSARSQLKQFTRPAQYLHWSFDRADGLYEPEFIGGARAGFPDAKFVPPAPIDPAGHRANALAFDGQRSVAAHVPTPVRAGMTLAFWARVPADAALSEAGPMVAIAGESPATISWNREPAQGALGALRTETDQGRLIGAVSLRDGRWHHLAVVIMPGGKARQYVDGRLEGMAAKHAKGRRVERRARKSISGESAEVVMTLGGAAAGEGNEHFRGSIDELFLADRALTPPEIRQLLRENQPAPAPAAVIAER